MRSRSPLARSFCLLVVTLSLSLFVSPKVELHSPQRESATLISIVLKYYTRSEVYTISLRLCTLEWKERVGHRKGRQRWKGCLERGVQRRVFPKERLAFWKESPLVEGTRSEVGARSLAKPLASASFVGWNCLACQQTLLLSPLLVFFSPLNALVVVPFAVVSVAAVDLRGQHVFDAKDAVSARSEP